LTAVSRERLTLDDVVYRQDFRFARVNPQLLQDWHETRSESLELLLRIPDQADLQVALRSEAKLIVQSVRGRESLLAGPTPL
jgi:hypothetical protein